MSWMGGWFDPELEDLFHDEPELLETAQAGARRAPARRARSALPEPASRSARRRGIARPQRPRRAPLVASRTGALRLGRSGRRGGTDHRDRASPSSRTTPPDQTVTAFSQLTAQHSVSPNQVITVAFNQPMNEQAVEAGVHIQPAIKVTYSWKNNNLVISPAYHLSANTPYTVTIAQTAIRACLGRVRRWRRSTSPSGLRRRRLPAPWPRRRSVPRSSSVSNGTGGSLLYAPDGSAGQHRRSAPSVGDDLPEPNRRPLPAATPTASPTPTPEGAITQTPEVPGCAGRIPPLAERRPRSDRFRRVRRHSRPTAVVTWRCAVDDGNGGSTIVASQSDGTQTERLVELDNAGHRADLGDERSNHLHRRHHHLTRSTCPTAQAQLYTLPTGSGTITALAPGGAIRLRLAGHRHRRRTAQHQHRSRAGAPRAP